MLTAIIILSFLLLIAVIVVLLYYFVGRRAAKEAFDDLIEACRLSGVDSGSKEFLERMHRVSYERMTYRIELEHYESVKDKLEQWRGSFQG